MNIVLNRIDDRLIHGQVLVSWIKKLRVRQLLVIDDQLVDQQLAETVLIMALPVNIGLKILSVEEGGNYIQKYLDGKPPDTILLMRTPSVAKKLWDLGYEPKSLNLGGMAAGEKRRPLCRDLYASEEERELFREFRKAGIEVYVQIAFGEKKIYC